VISAGSILRVRPCAANADRLADISVADIMERFNLSSRMNHLLSASEMPSATPIKAGRTDRSLLRRLRSGEQDAATALYMRYARRLQAVARTQTSAALASRFDPEDVVQSVFRTFFRRATAGQYDVPEGEELWNLLLVISLNKIRALATFHKAAKRSATTTLSLMAADSPGAQQAAPENALQILEMVIDEALAELPESQRAIIRLRIEGHAVDEIAGATRRSKRTVERALQQFRTLLGRLLFEEPEGDAQNS
jgi:RNA polymerase sigma-70 factor (ECF subfamily)